MVMPSFNRNLKAKSENFNDWLKFKSTIVGDSKGVAGSSFE